MSVPALAREAFSAWDGAPDTLRLINQRENAVFEAGLRDGTRCVLRLHRPGYRNRAEIRSELQWCAALAEAGVPAPRPLPARDGSLVVTVGGAQLATVIAWIDGAPIGAGDTPLSGTADQRRDIFHALGRALAQVHSATDAMSLPEDFTRPPWDRAALVGPDPAWGRFWDHPALTAAERGLLARARARADEVLAAHPDLDCGLIHADALRENVFRTARGLVLIDYDDSGYGYRLYDLAVAVSQSLGDPDYDDLRGALVAGYASLRPLSARDLTLLPLFAALRACASLGWTMPRMAADDPGAGPYLARARLAAERFLAGDGA